MKKIALTLLFPIALATAPVLSAQQEDPLKRAASLIQPRVTGRFEVTVHYGYWSLNPVKSLFESAVIDRLSTELRKEIANQSVSLNPSVVRTNFEQSLAFDSSGSDMGVEVRYYPKGRNGGFSLGFSIERTLMRMSIQGPVRQEFNDGSVAQAEINGFLELKPFSSNFNISWDFVPRWIVSPYFVLGLGIAPLTGDFGYDFTGSYRWQGLESSISDADIKTLKEWEEGIDFNIPNIFVIVQTALGLRVLVASHLVIRAEAGFWDGIILRGGLGFRF